MGALTPLFLGTATETANVSGKWFVPWARETDFHGPEFEGLGTKLWDWVQAQRSSGVNN